MGWTDVVRGLAVVAAIVALIGWGACRPGSWARRTSADAYAEGYADGLTDGTAAEADYAYEAGYADGHADGFTEGEGW